MKSNWKLLEGDCVSALDALDADSVDLIITSPPYAMQRADSYGGIPEDEYVGWFLERAESMRRVLKPTGSFILNIKENVKDCQRRTYVYETVLAMVDAGWLWVEEFVWHKSSSYPNGQATRFRDGWERIYQFSLTKEFKLRKDNVSVTASKSAIKLASAQKDKLESGEWDGKTRHINTTGSGMQSGQLGNHYKSLEKTAGKVYPPNVLFGCETVENVKTNSRLSSSGSGLSHTGSPFRPSGSTDKSYPNNVLFGSPNTIAVTSEYKHPATFPSWLPEWFIDAFTDTGDVVLDPFAGSGTTLEAALKRGRLAVGCEIVDEYCRMIRKRLRAVPEGLPF